MPIVTRPAPRGGEAVLAANITDILRERRVPHGMKTEMHPEDVSHSEPHPVYVAGLDDLADGKLLAAAKQTGWRYLLVHGDAAVGEAELSAETRAPRGAKSARSKEPQFLGLTHGPFTAATIDALHAAERLPQIEKADYELRLLKVPAVYLVALWLHSGSEDILIPLGQPPAGLKKNRPYTEAGIIRALRATALRTKEFQDSYESSQGKRRPKKR